MLTESIHTDTTINLISSSEKSIRAYFYRLPNLKISCTRYLVQFGKIHEIWDDFDAFIKTLDKDTICELFHQVIL
jgi:speckle-type POZ protein